MKKIRIKSITVKKALSLILAMTCTWSVISCGKNQQEELAVNATLAESKEQAESHTDNNTEESQLAEENDTTKESQPSAENDSTEENKPAEENNNTKDINIIMVGDILMHTRVEESARQSDGTYDFDPIFSNVEEEIKEADLAIVNQEVIIGGEELGISGYPCFNAPYELGDSLVKAGFDVVCHGTNHALDKGKAGVLNCISFWNNNYPGIAVLGINETEKEQDDIYIYEQDGIKVAVLNYTYGTNGIAMPEGMPYAVDLLEEEKVIADIERAEQIADFTVVCPHWGTEYVLEQTAEQERWAQIFLEKGVDLVIGTHPHVIEPVELLVDENTGHEMLGNFVNWTSESGAGKADRMVGGMADVTIGYDENGQVVIKDYLVTALVCHVSYGEDGVYTMKLSDYTQELAGESEMVNQDASFSKEYCINLCNQVWGDLWE